MNKELDKVGKFVMEDLRDKAIEKYDGDRLELIRATGSIGTA